jgi:hypothetical protein
MKLPFHSILASCFCLGILFSFSKPTLHNLPENGITVLTGKITAEEKGKAEGLIGATIKVLKGTEMIRGAISDYEGNYRMQLDPGTYDVEVSYTGLKTHREPGVVVLEGVLNQFDVMMTPNTNLNEVVISAYKVPLIAQDNTSTGDLTSREIHKTSKAAPSTPAGVSTTTAKAAPLAEPASLEVVAKKDIATDEAELPLVPARTKTTSGCMIVQAPVQPKAGQLTAGEWNDLHNWNRHWVDLIGDGEIDLYQKKYAFYPQNRYTVILTNNQGCPLTDLAINLTTPQGEVVWQSRTDNMGVAELWYGMFEQTPGISLKLEAVVKDRKIDLGKARPVSKGINQCKVNVDSEPSTNVDIMWVVDATGSMGDELNYLKSELEDVIRRSKINHPGLSFRTGALCYRDFGDDYLTRASDLNVDIQTTVDFLRPQFAGGGGDTEEAVDTALCQAIFRQPWSPNALARICFLVLDASPHNTPEINERLHKTIREAARRGIRIVPITGSGITKDTEFLMKFFGLATNGTYVFLTDHSGIGGKHIAPTAETYQIELLNNLLVRIISEYTATRSCDGISTIREEVAESNGTAPEAPKSIRFYPNPASVKVTVELPADAQVLQLFNAEGKLVKGLDKPTMGSNKLNVADLLSGMYTIRVVGEGKDQTGKLMVVH